MTKEREALTLAFKALTNAIAVRNGEGGTMLVHPLEENALTAIKEALATSPLPVQPNHIVDANKMVQPEHEPSWYCVDKIGMATLCADKDDAEQSAKLAEQDFPRNSPYRAVQLCEYTPAITAHNIGAK